MSIKLDGEIKDECGDVRFIADTYYEPGEISLKGINWFNITTNQRTFNPDKGACIWRIKGNLASGSLGTSILFDFKILESKVFRENMKDGFFSKSKYSKIVSKIKDKSFDNYLVLTREQAKYCIKRYSVLMPEWKDFWHKVSSNVKWWGLEEYFFDSFAGWYESIAILDMATISHDNPPLHPARLWFNLETKEQTIGPNQYTILLKIAADDKVKETIQEYDFKYLVNLVCSLWNDCTMKNDYNDYKETILKEVMSKGLPNIDENTKFNHHIVITDNQLPDKWVWKDGKYVLKNNTDDDGAGLLGLFLSC